MYKVISFQISDSIDIKTFKSFFTAELVYSDSDELFFKSKDDQYTYVFKYGVVCFLNQDDIVISNFVKLIAPFCKNFFEYKLKEEYVIESNSPQTHIGNNKIEIVKTDIETFRIVMINVSQSVALDYYSDQTTLLLEEANKHTMTMENTGRLNISGKRLKKFIGKTLNLTNRITENLYIFDSTNSTWDDESLDRIDIELKKTFDLQARYKSIHEDLQIIKENLSLFKDIMHHQKSSFLEWVVVILILVEVLNLLLSKIA